MDLRGVDDKEVEIAVDLQKMENLDISFNGISDAIKYENMSVSGGDLLVDGYRRNIRVLGEFESMQDIENIIVKQEKGAIVYLRDIAKVQFTNVDRESYAREFKNPVVSLDVKKRSGENLIKVSASINEVIAKARESYFPKNLALSVTNDQSNRTKNQVGELENSIIFGIILVVLVLTFFLGLRNALFVGIAIPLSMLLSFLILNSLGVTLNFMVLFGLVLALGMLVDNGVVIVENIYRFRTLGYSAKEASMLGSGEVAMPIISSTATTLAAFLPLALWPGLIGEFIKYLPLTLIVVLGSSLFVALVVNPALASRYMKLEADVVNRPKWTKIGAGLTVVGLVLNLALGFTTLGNLLFWPGFLTLIYLWGIEPLTNKFMAGGLPRLERWYEGNVQKILSKNNAAKTLLATVGLFVLSFILMAIIPPKVVFFPDNQPNLANIYIEMPVGTDIEETNHITKEMEDKIEGLLKVYEYPVEGKPYNYMVESVIAQVGKCTSDPNEGPANQATPHKAKIVVAFREMKYRLDAEGSSVASADVLNLLRDNISTIPGVLIAVEKDQNGPPQGAPINIELSGEDYEELLAAAEGLRKTLVNSRIKGYDELKIDVTGDKPELPIIVDRAKARTLGVSTGQIGDALRTALFGKEISRYKKGESDYPINIRFDDRFRFNLESLMNQKITFRDQSSGRIKQVPISAIATPSKTATFSAVKRNDLNRVITVYSGIEEGANANLIIAEMQLLLKNYELPKGVTLNYTGQQEEQAKELGFLYGALLISVFLIFLIIVGQFN